MGHIKMVKNLMLCEIYNNWKKKVPPGLVGSHITLSGFFDAGIRRCSIRPAPRWLLSKPT